MVFVQQRIDRSDHRNLREYGLQFVTEQELVKIEKVWKTTEEVV